MSEKIAVDSFEDIAPGCWMVCIKYHVWEPGAVFIVTKVGETEICAVDQKANNWHIIKKKDLPEFYIMPDENSGSRLDDYSDGGPLAGSDFGTVFNKGGEGLSLAFDINWLFKNGRMNKKLWCGDHDLK